MELVKRFEIYLVSLDPTKGNEIKKTRPCLIISPNEMNTLSTVIVAPMTTKSKPFPTRIDVHFEGKNGFIVLDQIRTIDKTRLQKKLGTLDKNTGVKVLKILQEMFEN